MLSVLVLSNKPRNSSSPKFESTGLKHKRLKKNKKKNSVVKNEKKSINNRERSPYIDSIKGSSSRLPSIERKNTRKNILIKKK